MYKTSGAQKLDLFYNGDPAAFAEGLGWMQANPGSLPDAAREMANAGHLDPGDPQKLKDGWTAPPSNNPLHGKDVERVMRRAYEKAIGLAQHGGKRIESFIVTGSGSDFGVHVSNGSAVVSVFIVLPNDYPGSETASATSWVFRVGSTGEDVPEVNVDDGDPPVVRARVSGSAQAADAAESLPSA
jgi:hypothetical protein